METESSNLANPKDLSSLLDRLLGFASAAERVAQRWVGKIRKLGSLALLSAVWLTYAIADTFNAYTAIWLVVGALLMSVPVLLLVMGATLQGIVGLPQRISRSAAEAIDAAKYSQAQVQSMREAAPQSVARPTLRHLWRSYKWLTQARGLSNEAQRLIGEAGGALVIANPVFGIVLVVASVIALAQIGIAAVVGIAYLI